MKVAAIVACLGAVFLLGSSESRAADFFDDFNDGDAVGWSFAGPNSAHWSVSDGRLIHQTPAGYTGTTETALITGWDTPSQFLFEADVAVLGSIFGSDWGHVGLIWNVADPLVSPGIVASDFGSINTSYLRTHSDHVTSWSFLNQTSAGENFVATPGTINGQTYHLSVENDSVARSITVSLDNHSQTFSGSAYDQINQSMSGGIGLISWNDTIAFDNVSLTVVPEPSPLVLLGACVAGVFLARRLRNPSS